MKPCPRARAWQAEAALDGRLAGADIASFERHAASCEVCSREIRELAALNRIGARLPALTSTPLERRRLRHELLRRANELALHAPSANGKRPLLVALAGVIVATLLLFWQFAPAPASRASDDKVPTFQLETSMGAEWGTLHRGPTLRLSVQQGWFEFSVDTLQVGQRFVLQLPDGELEVRGTRFVLSLDGDRTESVHVREGRVELRLEGQRQLVLIGGDSWRMDSTSMGSTDSAPPDATTPAPPDATTPAMDAAEPFDVEGKVPASRSPKPRPDAGSMITGPLRDKNSTQPPAASAKMPSAGQRFAKAISAFSAGDYGNAEQLLTEFERYHPGDARVEDATFLRAVARSRRGDAAAAGAIARDYLRRYPKGLRRAEAERLLR